jgi:hypothetical protein
MKRKFSVLFVCAALLAGCAGGTARMRGEDTSQKYVDYAGAPVDSFTTFNINGWTPVSRDQLVVWTGVNEAYLLKVWSTCQDLLFAERVAITSTTRTISKFEKVRVGRDQCPIEEIRPIDIKQMKADRAAARATAK